ncbi:two-component system sensor histidine kinase RstB [Gallaecimonas pentaromativorans]|uniref:histidine kinase n=1 Tax=Gallaecimonas pentaromativorans TaxID=584787 RepID=A0A3N1PVJ6_9GAMM|nr:two-component system sensor histidine kinase RstB [Gallaecimonas pentaromativorans]ROQ28576.1 two-component system sensor histidine kinase RstB [Gallaecimonas pentaromativorans]
MRRLFTQFYLLVFACFLAAALLIGGVYQFTAERASNRYLEGLVQDFLDRFTQQMADVPASQWPGQVEDFGRRLHLTLRIGALSEQPLAPADLNFLSQGNILIVEDDATFRQRIPGTDQVLIIGPVPYLHFQHELHWLVLGLLILLGLSLAFPILLWMRPHWRGLQRLEAAAKRLGRGELDARAALPSKSSLATLGATFDQMASQLQSLIAGRKQLTDAIAHELRTPLVRLRYRLAMQEPPLAPKALAELERDLNAFEYLIDEMLVYSRLNEPEPALNIGTLELGQWAAEHLADWQAQGAGRTLELTGPPAPLYWQGDGRLLERAMDNLVGNALRHCRQQVQIALREEDGQAALKVTDDGPGVAAEAAARIFEPFVRLDESRNRRTGGIGLGLAIVRSIAHLHGGDVRLEGPGPGASFTLLLPVHSVTKRHQGATELP